MSRQLMVNVQHSVDGSVTVLPLSTASTLEELRTAWATATRLDPRDHFLRLFGGGELPADGAIADVLQPGAFVLAVTVEPCGSLSVLILGAPSLRTSVQLHAQTSEADVVRQVLDTFGLGDRQMRLLRNGDPLLPDRALSDQGVRPGDEVMADLQVTVRVVTRAAVDFEGEDVDDDISDDDDDDNDDGGDVEIAAAVAAVDAAVAAAAAGPVPPEPEVVVHEDRVVQCFLSEPATRLLSDHLAADSQRLLCGRRVVSRHGAVVEALEGGDVLTKAEWVVHVEHAIPICVQRMEFDSVGVSEVVVWPSDRVRVLISSKRQRVFSENGEVDPRKTFAEVDARQLGLFKVSEPLSLTVRDSLGRSHVVHVDREATASDLRQRLNAFEAGAAFAIECDGRPLPDEPWTLARCGVESRSALVIKKLEVKVALLYAGRVIDMGGVVVGVDFEGFLTLAGDALGREDPLPRDTWFECACGRVVSNASGQRRRLPSRCCEAEDERLVLTVHLPVDVSVFTRDDGCLRLRLPLTAPLSAVMSSASRASRANRRHRRLWAGDRPLAEHQQLHDVPNDGKRVSLRLEQKLRLRVQLGSEQRVVTWAVHPDDEVPASLDQMVASGLSDAVDLAVRGGRRLGVRSNGALKTFREWRLRDKQLVTLVEAPRPEVGVQAVIARVEASAGTERTRRTHSAGQAGVRTSFSQQQPPLERRPLIVVDCRPGSVNRSLKITTVLPPQATVGAVLAVLAAELGTAPGRIRLSCNVAESRVRRREVHQVANNGDELWTPRVYADAEGLTYGKREVEEVAPRDLDNRAAILPVTPGRTLALWVHRSQ